LVGVNDLSSISCFDNTVTPEKMKKENQENGITQVHVENGGGAQFTMQMLYYAGFLQALGILWSSIFVGPVQKH